MLNGELTPRSTLNGELTGGIFYGTNDYEELINKPSINNIELAGNKSLTDLGIDIPTATSQLTNDSGFITSADVPTATSQLVNDSGFITSADVPTATSQLVNDSGFITSADIPAIPTKTSDLTNDSGFITSAAVPSRTSQIINDSGFITSADIPTDVSAFTNDAGYITSADIPTDVSAFTNDAGYITSADIPTDVSAFTNDAGYISNSDLMTATASGNIATFSNGGDDIPVSEFECEIVATGGGGTPTTPIAINGFSQADIGDSGINLFDGILEKGYISITDGEDTPNTSGNQWRCKNHILVKPNMSLYMKLPNGYTTSNSNITVYYYDANKNFIGYESNKGDTVIQMPSNCHWFRFCNYVVVATQNSPTGNSLNYPSTDTQYHAYTGNLYTVAFGQTIYGGRLIYENGEWSIEATHSIVDLGTLSWNSTTLGSQNVWRASLPTGVKGYADNYVPTNILCEQYPPNSVDNMYSGQSGVALRSSQSYIYCSRTDLNEPQGKLVAELTTQTIIPITSSTRVKTISGDNNIYSSTGDCELKYFTNKADSIAELVKAFVL